MDNLNGQSPAKSSYQHERAFALSFRAQREIPRILMNEVSQLAQIVILLATLNPIRVIYLPFCVFCLELIWSC